MYKAVAIDTNTCTAIGKTCWEQLENIVTLLACESRMKDILILNVRTKLQNLSIHTPQPSRSPGDSS